METLFAIAVIALIVALSIRAVIVNRRRNREWRHRPDYVWERVDGFTVREGLRGWSIQPPYDIHISRADDIILRSEFGTPYEAMQQCDANWPLEEEYLLGV